MTTVHAITLWSDEEITKYCEYYGLRLVGISAALVDGKRVGRVLDADSVEVGLYTSSVAEVRVNITFYAGQERRPWLW